MQSLWRSRERGRAESGSKRSVERESGGRQAGERVSEQQTGKRVIETEQFERRAGERVMRSGLSGE